MTHERLTQLGGRRIGPHLPLTTGLRGAPERAAAVGAGAIQIFIDDPTTWRRRTAPPPALAAFRERLAALDIGPLAIHGPYLANLAASDRVFRARSVATVARELSAGREYGARFVVFHIGSPGTGTPEEGIAHLGRGLAAALSRLPDVPDTPLLVLENSAGGGGGFGSSIRDLGAILDVAVRAGVAEHRIGFCLDTAHLWGAGHDLSSPESIEALLDEWDAEVGAARLVMMHLNDSKADRGSRADRHEHIGTGNIGWVGLRHLLIAPRLHAVPAYLETPAMDLGYDALNMDRVRLLIAGKPLPGLPDLAPDA